LAVGWVYGLFGGGSSNSDPDLNAPDPFGSAFTSHTSSVPITGSVAGAPSSNPASNTTGFTAGGDFHLPLVNLNNGSQRLTAGVYFNGANALTTYASPAAIGQDSVRQMLYNIGAAARYDIGDTYLQGKLGVLFGNGKASYADASSGNFSSVGASGDLKVGREYTLVDHRTFAAPLLATKAAPKSQPSVNGGYDIKLVLSGGVFWLQDTIHGFTDTSGFVLGDEFASTWGASGYARVEADIYSGQYVWTPYAGIGVDQLIGFSHRLAVPDQGGTPGGTLFLVLLDELGVGENSALAF
jgi:hypothetical protein